MSLSKLMKNYLAHRNSRGYSTSLPDHETIMKHVCFAPVSDPGLKKMKPQVRKTAKVYRDDDWYVPRTNFPPLSIIRDRFVAMNRVELIGPNDPEEVRSRYFEKQKKYRQKKEKREEEIKKKLNRRTGLIRSVVAEEESDCLGQGSLARHQKSTTTELELNVDEIVIVARKTRSGKVYGLYQDLQKNLKSGLFY